NGNTDLLPDNLFLDARDREFALHCQMKCSTSLVANKAVNTTSNRLMKTLESLDLISRDSVTEEDEGSSGLVFEPLGVVSGPAVDAFGNHKLVVVSGVLVEGHTLRIAVTPVPQSTQTFPGVCRDLGRILGEVRWSGGAECGVVREGPLVEFRDVATASELNRAVAPELRAVALLSVSQLLGEVSAGLVLLLLSSRAPDLSVILELATLDHDLANERRQVNLVVHAEIGTIGVHRVDEGLHVGVL